MESRAVHDDERIATGIERQEKGSRRILDRNGPRVERLKTGPPTKWEELL